MSKAKLAVIVLAAGKGTRMKSDLPKVMHKLAGRPIIHHVLAVAAELEPAETIVVLAPGMDQVAEAVQPAKVAIQDNPLGTGHAVAAAQHALSGEAEDVLILNGDGPLITAATLRSLVEERRRRNAAVAVLGMEAADPSPYGRLITGKDGLLDRIVESKDASPEERAVTFCNSGMIAIEARHLAGLIGALDRRNVQGEYYLTDIVGIARRQGLTAIAVPGPFEETAGINSRAHLAEAEAVLQRRLREAAMANGATLTAPETVFLSWDTKIGRDVTIGPFVVCGPGVVIEDGAEILGFCHFTAARIGKGAQVGPYARLRPGAQLGEDVHIGNFVEVKNSVLGRGAKANHLSYIGDSEVGAKANVGAGTITCNYDGFFKEKTVIGEGAFIGSNTALVAPVTVGAGAITGAGSVITRDVPADALALERAPQTEKPGWARQFRKTRAAEKAARAAKKG